MLKYEKVWKATLFVVIAETIILTLLTRVISVHGISMEPTLHDGDTRLGVRTAHADVGDIIVVYSEDSEGYVVKRVVAVAGDTVTYNHSYVSVNGEVVCDGPSDFARTAVLQERQVFLVGDNYGVSFDSRYYGVFDLPNTWFKVILIDE